MAVRLDLVTESRVLFRIGAEQTTLGIALAIPGSSTASIVQTEKKKPP